VYIHKVNTSFDLKHVCSLIVPTRYELLKLARSQRFVPSLMLIDRKLNMQRQPATAESVRRSSVRIFLLWILSANYKKQLFDVDEATLCA
jgi:hypothetical protein